MSNRILLALMLALVWLTGRTEPTAAYMLPQGCNQPPAIWSNLVPTFRANWFAGSSPVNDFDEAIQIFNANPTSMSFWWAIDFGPHVVGMNNGHTEVWPYLELTPADIFDGDQFAAIGIAYVDGCDIVEGDVIFNLAYDWVHTTQKSDYDAYGDPAADISAKVAGVHELGHVVGFAHDCSIYNVMGMAWRHLWANGPEAEVYIGEPMTAGLVDTYSGLGAPTLQSPDVSVSHWQYDSCLEGGYSEHRRTRAFDLAGDPLDQVGGEDEPRFIAAAGQTIEVDFTFENQGNTLEEGVEVGFYYSDDDTITTMDQRLGGTTFDFVRNDPDTRRLTVDLPLTLPQGDGYLGVIVDDNDSITESREENNATYVGMRIEGQDADGDGEPDDGTEVYYRYAAKVVCGFQDEPADLRLRPGVYATTVNIFNPDVDTVRFDKRLAVSYPPDPQIQGETYEFGFDSLDPLHALETNCDELIEMAFNGVPPQPYFEGFVIVTSPASLDVTAVYSGSGGPTSDDQSDGSGGDGKAHCYGKSCGCGCCGCSSGDGGNGGGSGGGGGGTSLTLDVEQIRERIVQGPPPPDNGDGAPDLIPERPFDGDGSGAPDSGYCMALPNPPGEAERIRVIVRNQGDAAAPASQTSVVFGVEGAAPPPDTAVRIAQTPALDPALGPNDTATHEFRIPTACYGPPDTQCRFVIMVDAGPEAVIESNEANNTAHGHCDNFDIAG